MLTESKILFAFTTLAAVFFIRFRIKDSAIKPSSDEEQTRRGNKTAEESLSTTSVISRLKCLSPTSTMRKKPPPIQRGHSTRGEGKLGIFDNQLTHKENVCFQLTASVGDKIEVLDPTQGITIPVQARSYVHLTWLETPKLVLVVMRFDEASFEGFLKVAKYFWSRNITIIVEDNLRFAGFKPEGSFIVETRANIHTHPVDLIVGLGGDGTFIHATHAFPGCCPPIIAFNFGSLGFLAPFKPDNVEPFLNYAMGNKVALRLRARLEAKIKRKNQEEEEIHQILNEVVIHRGVTSSLARLILCSRKRHQNTFVELTTVQGDGLICATPTGSTAYSLGCGGSMVHPEVACILVTPIAPTSLSFRPLIVPDSEILKIRVSPEARGPAWISCDGRPNFELVPGDELYIQFSPYPVPAILPEVYEDGWLGTLRSALNWNATTALQKPT